MIPLILRLKKAMHKDVAKAQDLIVEEVYKVFNNAVLHGGTAIWRCYSSKRFSEDIDVYLTRDIKKIELLFNNLKKKGFIIDKKKISKNSLYSSLRLDRTNVKLEALFKQVSSILKEYETVEGNLITVYTLSVGDFIKEKIETYLKRFKIRDLYDVFYLLRFETNFDDIKNILNYFIKNFKKPIDENNLRVLILEGIVPTTDKMLDYIKRSIKNG